jgi:SSS family solute:Na+ symporter
MPLYMLMYPLLVFVAYYGVSHAPKLQRADHVFLVVVRDLAPPWIVGLVVAGAGLAALIVLAGNSLMFAGVFSRNLAPSMRKAKTSSSLNLVMAGFLVLTATLSTLASSIMLSFLTLALALTTQLVPAWFGVMFFRKLRAGALSIGMIVGCMIVAVFYFTGQSLGNINSGLIALVVNFAVAAFCSSFIRTGAPKYEPVGMRGREILAGRPLQSPSQPVGIQ